LVQFRTRGKGRSRIVYPLSESKRSARPLTTVERHGAKIRNTKIGTKGIIVGTDSMSYGGELLYGFRVRVPAERKTLFLPFRNTDDWVVDE